VSVQGLEHLKSLDLLEEFHFVFTLDFDLQAEAETAITRVYSWAGQNLPKIKLIGYSIFDSEDDIHSDFYVEHSPEFSGVSFLETLHVNGRLPQASLPKLKKLHFRGRNLDSTEDVLPTLSTYSNLTYLVLEVVAWEKMVLILRHIGKQLSHLCCNMDGHQGTVDHYQIFHLCPNLVSYKQEMFHKPTLDSPSKLLLSQRNFRNLEVCKTAGLPSDLMAMILRAPSIRVFDCDGEISKAHCQYVEAIERFPSLERIYVSYVTFHDDCGLDDLEKMVKKIVCCAPQLKQISVSNISFRRKWEICNAFKYVQLVNNKNKHK